MAFEPHKQYQQGVALNAGADMLSPTMAVRRDVNTSAVSDGQYEALHTDSAGRLKISSLHSAFDAVTGTLTANLQSVVADVSRAGSATVFFTGTYATGLTATFEATADGANWVTIMAQPTNIQPVGVTTGALAAGTGANPLAWDISPLLGLTQIRVRSTTWAAPTGAVNVRIMPAVQSPELAPAGGAVTISSGTVTTVATLTDSSVAHGGADGTTRPHKMGGQARLTHPVAVADTQRVNFIGDKFGKQIIAGSIRDLKVQQTTTITNSVAETTIITAAGATFYLDLYGLIIANTSATVCAVAIKDATAGTTRITASILPGDTFTFLVPESGAHPQATLNSNWTATCSASVSSIVVTALAVKSF